MRAGMRNKEFILCGLSIRISTSWSSVSLENINHKYKVISTSERQGSLLEMIVKKL